MCITKLAGRRTCRVYWCVLVNIITVSNRYTTPLKMLIKPDRFLNNIANITRHSFMPSVNIAISSLPRNIPDCEVTDTQKDAVQMKSVSDQCKSADDSDMVMSC